MNWIKTVYSRLFPILKKRKNKPKSLEKIEKHPLHRLSLRARFLLSILSVVVLSTGTIAYFSYSIAEDMLLQANEDRLKREVQISKERAEYLKLSYVNDLEQFEKQINYGIRAQAAELTSDGLHANFFRVDEDAAIRPFAVSQSAELPLHKEEIEDILDKESGSVYKVVDGKELHLVFDYVQDLRETIILAVPTLRQGARSSALK